ncbi:hypothetical protein [Myxosarcina sp. GI1(2024)]
MKSTKEFHNDYYRTSNDDLLNADQINGLTYRQLQTWLKKHPFDNFNRVKLNSKTVVLRAELAEIMDEVEKLRYEFSEFLKLVDQYKNSKWDIKYSANDSEIMLTLHTLDVKIEEKQVTSYVSLYCIAEGNHPSNTHGELDWFSIDTLYEHWKEGRAVIRTNNEGSEEPLAAMSQADASYENDSLPTDSNFKKDPILEIRSSVKKKPQELLQLTLLVTLTLMFVVALITTLLRYLVTSLMWTWHRVKRQPKQSVLTLERLEPIFVSRDKRELTQEQRPRTPSRTIAAT